MNKMKEQLRVVLTLTSGLRTRVHTCTHTRVNMHAQHTQTHQKGAGSCQRLHAASAEAAGRERRWGTERGQEEGGEGRS